MKLATKVSSFKGTLGMTEPPQKKHERYLLDAFLTAANIDATIEDDRSECPDMVIRTNEGRVGVEITELFNTATDGDDRHSLKASESNAQKIVSRASEIYCSNGSHHAHVSVHFDLGSDNLRKKSCQEQIAKELAELVANHKLGPDSHKTWRQDGTGLLRNEIRFVNMLGVPNPEMAHWSAPSAGWVTRMALETLQRCVDGKARHLEKYRQRVETIWLLIASDGTSPSQFFEPPTREQALAISSPLDRTFYLSIFKNQVLELGRTRNET